MDIGRSFGFVTEDEEWVKKIVIGGLIFLGFFVVGSFIPGVAVLPVYGYMIQTARRVVQTHSRPLPNWDNFGDTMMKGLYALIISIAYTIPLIVLSAIAFLLGGGMAVVSGDDAGGAVGGIALLCLTPVLFVLGLLTWFFVTAAFVRYIMTDKLSSAFEFNEIFAMLRKDPGMWGMLLVVSILISIVGSLGLIACGVGVLFTAVYATAVNGHLLGQVALKYSGTGSNSNFTIPPTYGSPA
jgi:hypothetical protein